MKNLSSPNLLIRMALFLLVWAIAGSNLCFAGARDRNAPLSVPEGGCRVSVAHGRVSLEAKACPLHVVTAKLSRSTGVRVDLAPGVKGMVTASFSGLRVSEALRRIARNWGMVFEEKEDASGGNLRRVLITQSIPAGRKNRPGGVPPGRMALLLRPRAGPGGSLSASGPSGQVDGSPTGVTPRAKPGAPEKRWVSGQALVRFRKDEGRRQIEALLSTRGLRVVQYDAVLDYYLLSLPRGLEVPEALAWLQGRKEVVWAGPNRLIPVQDTPDDPRFSQQWALERIRAPQAWEVEWGSETVIIAVIDTGVDYTHPDLEGKIWENPGEVPANGVDDDGNGFVDDVRGWDFVENTKDCASAEDCHTQDNDPMDFQGHGTHVAGIAAAEAQNALGVAGTAPGCLIMAVRAGYEQSGGGGYLAAWDAGQAIRYAADNGARVLNLSWGYTEESSGVTDYVTHAVDYALGKGVLVCAAAGNSNSEDFLYPAALDREAVLAVGSTDSGDQKASTSSFGLWVDVSAPGVGILSTCVGGVYCTKSGTSMATAHVSGLGALLFSRFPSWTAAEVADRILSAADVLLVLEGYNRVSGRINALSSLTLGFPDTFGLFACPEDSPCEGDLDGDGDSDGVDLGILARLHR